MRAKNGAGWMWGTAIALMMGGAMILWAGSKETPAGKAPGAGVDRVPEGARFPVCWKHEFTAPEKIAVGQDFEVKIRITAALFDMKEVELQPAAGGELKLVKGEPWKGALKQGEAREVVMTLQATTNGFNGPYGVVVKAPRFYDEVKAYVMAQTEGPYADEGAKESILDQLQGMRQEQPQCEEWVGGAITVGAEGGK